MTKKPPCIELYDWPNVPKAATEIADGRDLDNIGGVAFVPASMKYSSGDRILCAFHREDVDGGAWAFFRD